MLLAASLPAADAPRLTGEVDAAGLAAAIAKEKGRVVLVNFWATWCVPCREEFPDLVKLEKTYRARGLSVLGVSTDLAKDMPAVEKFLASAKPEFANYRKEERRRRPGLHRGRRPEVGRRAAVLSRLRPRREEGESPLGQAVVPELREGGRGTAEVANPVIPSEARDPFRCRVPIDPRHGGKKGSLVASLLGMTDMRAPSPYERARAAFFFPITPSSPHVLPASTVNINRTAGRRASASAPL
jgi:thiol-disulfide isomerase/thioredoxin